MNWPWQENKFEWEVKIVLGNLVQQQNEILRAVKQIDKKVDKMAKELEALQGEIQELIANVAAEADVVAAATIAIQGLTDQQAILIQELQEAIAASDPAAIQAAADDLATQNDAQVALTAALAAAIPAKPPTE